MSNEDAIRERINEWLRASKDADLAALANLLDDDVLFVVQGRPPFGKKEFLAGGVAAPFRFEWKVEVPEVVVHGDWGLTRVHLELEIMPAPDSEPMRLAGPAMSVWRKSADGRWVIWRDANMVRPVE